MAMEESSDAAGQSDREDKSQPSGSLLKNLVCHFTVMSFLTVGKNN